MNQLQPTRDKPTIAVAAAIIERDGKILACQRATGDYAGYWEFPGGKVEPKETAQQACKREILEELACKLSTTWLLDTITYEYPTFHLVMDCFVCMLVPKSEPQPLEHAQIRWLAKDELLDVTWLPADNDLVRLLGTQWEAVFGDEHL